MRTVQHLISFSSVLTMALGALMQCLPFKLQLCISEGNTDFLAALDIKKAFVIASSMMNRLFAY
jgi:hypothetical protein